MHVRIAARTESDLRMLKKLRAFYRALSDNARLRILQQLARQNLTVSELVRGLQMSQPLVSWHLHRLVHAGLVNIERHGREKRCSLNRAHLDECEREFESLIARG